MRSLGIKRIRKLLDQNLELRWDREGEVRRVPKHVIQNAVQSFTEGVELIDADRMGTIMEHAHSIRWEQTEEIDGPGSALISALGGDGVHPRDETPTG